MAESKEALLKQQCEKYMQRVCMYIDGANFYYSFYETRTDIVLGWCDFRKLAENYLIDSNSKLESINYFYAPVEDLAHSSDEERRQNTWLDAIRIYSKVKSYKGFYSGKKPTDRKEKQTDVNIAVRMLLDAFDDKYDNAILVSGDTDLAPAVLAVQKDLPLKKSVQVCVPLSEPSPYWTNLGAIEGFPVKRITAEMLSQSRLPNEITVNKHSRIKCPEKWRSK